MVCWRPATIPLVHDSLSWNLETLNTHLPLLLTLPIEDLEPELKKIQVQYNHKKNPFPGEYHNHEFRIKETERLRELAEKAVCSPSLDALRRRVSVSC